MERYPFKQSPWRNEGVRGGKKCREGNEKQTTKIQDRCLSTRVGIIETFRGSMKGSKTGDTKKNCHKNYRLEMLIL